MPETTMPQTRTAPRQQRDALGRRLCRVPSCGKLVGKGRRSYCSKECATEFEIAYFPSRTRAHVRARDHGVCALCGCDTEKLYRIFRHVRKFHDGYSGAWNVVAWVAKELGFNGAWGGDLWQADHIQECARGGWGKGLDNFRTLCTPCHKEETKRLARELAEGRRLALSDAPLFEGRAAS